MVYSLKSDMEIAVPFVQIQARNPNIKDSEFADSGLTYFKCILVCFATLRNVDPKANLVLYTNIEPPSSINAQLRNLLVETRIQPYTFNPPEIFGDTFRGCFYLFDAIKNSTSSTLFIDPDIVAVDSVSDIEKYCGNKVGVFELDYSEHESVNGISISAAHRIYLEFLRMQEIEAFEKSRRHLGGEAIFVPKSSITQLSQAISSYWEWNKKLAFQGKPYLTTEEHIITNILSPSQTVLLNPFISRIWTTKKFTKHQGNSQNIFKLKLWHLPSEKSRGFLKMYDLLAPSGFEIRMDTKTFMKSAKKIMSIDRPSFLISSYIAGKIRKYFMPQ
jgi:hypothetical protein